MNYSICNYEQDSTTFCSYDDTELNAWSSSFIYSNTNPDIEQIEKTTSSLKKTNFVANLRDLPWTEKNLRNTELKILRKDYISQI